MQSKVKIDNLLKEKTSTLFLNENNLLYTEINKKKKKKKRKGVVGATSERSNLLSHP